jgi:hypothetical protein
VSKTIAIIGHFVFHIVVATFLFVALALAALGVWYFTQWLKDIGAPWEIWFTCTLISELLFGLDVLCLLVFVVAEVWKLLREIYFELRGK